jgi:hypothetical protein
MSSHCEKVCYLSYAIDLPTFEIWQISLKNVQKKHKSFEEEVPANAPMTHLTKWWLQGWYCGQNNVPLKQKVWLSP